MLVSVVRIEWAKARAHSMRWREEVSLLEEEMRRTTAFLLWRSDWWTQQVGRRGLPEGPQLEGETAYALRQAAVQSQLVQVFAAEWEALPTLIRQGRSGPVLGEVEEVLNEVASDDEDEGSSGEEDEPIPKLPQREVKSSYVDEVLVM